MNQKFHLVISAIIVIICSVSGYRIFGVLGLVFMLILSLVCVGLSIFHDSLKNSVYIKSRTPFYLETNLDKELIKTTIKDFLATRNFNEINYLTGEIVYSFKSGVFEDKKYIAYHFDKNILVIEAWISKGGKEETPVDLGYYDKSDKHFVKRTVEDLIDKLNSLGKSIHENIQDNN